MPFHWNDKDEPKFVCVRIIQNEGTLAPGFCNEEFDWSESFSLEEQGSLTIQNRVSATTNLDDSFSSRKSGEKDS
jgi:hypothetical protein